MKRLGVDRPKGTVGVIGGMGPLATVDFLNKLVNATSAICDQEHLPLLVRFCPDIPDRVEALHGRGPSPVRALTTAAQILEQAGAECLAIACNTAHAWHQDIARAVSIPVLHIANATFAELEQGALAGPVGLLATTGTLVAGIYSSGSGAAVNWVTPNEIMQRDVMSGIRAIKANRIEEGTLLLRTAADHLVRCGAKSIVMGCTEIPLALSDQDVGVNLIDPTLALAKACVAWACAAKV